MRLSPERSQLFLGLAFPFRRPYQLSVSPSLAPARGLCVVINSMRPKPYRKSQSFGVESKDHGSSRQHYVFLDGLRAIAALAVVVLHICEPFGVNRLPHAYLAVDFFFVLSGFVVSYAYGSRIGSGVSEWFLKVRLIRLYPIILVAVALGAAVAAIGWRVKAETSHLPIWQLGTATILTAFLIPVAMLNSTTFFPLNPPLWSMSYEFIANLTYGILPALRKGPFLPLVISASALVLFGLVFYSNGISHDASWYGNATNVSRVMFGFFLGVFMQSKGVGRDWGVHPGLTVTALLLVFALPRGLWFVDILIIFIALPTVMAAGVAARVTGVAGRLCDIGGQISYPLYAVHYPLVPLFSHFARQHRIHGAMLASLIMLEFITAVVVAWLALVLIDRPIRKRLAFVLLGKSPVSFNQAQP